jgi:hypothetical protein
VGHAIGIISALALAGCSCGTATPELAVDLRTDLLPGREFTVVRARLERLDATEVGRREIGAFAREDFIAGRRVADLDVPASGEYLLWVELLDGTGAIVAARPTRLAIEGAVLVLVVISRDCQDRMCPTPADDPGASACFGGRCVDPRCRPDTPEICGTPECATDADCTSPVACAAPRCSGGICLIEARDSECAAGSVCHPERGCEAVPADAATDAGADAGSDAGTDAGVCPGAPAGWTAITTVGAPSGRGELASVWTGTEMLVWSGSSAADAVVGGGGRYDPVLDRWRPMSTSGEPAARSAAAAVWTGTEMIVWGGSDDLSTQFDDGGAYNPVTDSWRTLPDSSLAATERFGWVGTGDAMIIWGGATSAGTTQNGATFDIGMNRWSPIGVAGAPSPRKNPAAVWSGSQMIVWSGANLTYGTVFPGGGRWDPSVGWLSMSTAGEPPPRGFNGHAVWTGTEMVVWGGRVPSSAGLATGGRYDPASNTWRSTAPSPLAGRNRHVALWTGSDVLIWGGGSLDAEYGDGAHYDPAADTWAMMPAGGAPSPRSDHGAVWTGCQLIVWGGALVDDSRTNTGGRYTP